jgi:hypothetical protein
MHIVNVARGLFGAVLLVGAAACGSAEPAEVPHESALTPNAAEGEVPKTATGKHETMNEAEVVSPATEPQPAEKQPAEKSPEHGVTPPAVERNGSHVMPAPNGSDPLKCHK